MLLFKMFNTTFKRPRVNITINNKNKLLL